MFYSIFHVYLERKSQKRVFKQGAVTKVAPLQDCYNALVFITDIEKRKNPSHTDSVDFQELHEINLIQEKCKP